MAVPEMAAVRRGPLTGVFVVDGEGIARLRWVSLGETKDGRVEILSGLAAGERIVTEPPAGLEDGRTAPTRLQSGRARGHRRRRSRVGDEGGRQAVAR